MYQDSPHLLILRALSRCLHRLPPATLGNLQTIHSNQPRSPCSRVTLISSVDTLLHSSHTVLIHSIHVYKPSQDSVIYTTLIDTSVSSASLFVENSIIRVTPSILLKHFIWRKFTLFLSALLIPHISASYTIPLAHRHCFAFLANHLFLSTLFKVPHVLYPSLILCSTCRPRY